MFNYLKNRRYTSKKINKIYSQYLYTGFHGMLMRYCHRQLESKLPDKKFKKILEIGAGSEPHFSYIKNKDFIYLRSTASSVLIFLFLQTFLGILTVLSGAQIIIASMHQIGSIFLIATSLILVFKNSKFTIWSNT